MDVEKYYSSLPCDLAGSRSKNRFRLELLWGISVMLDLMKEDKDFTIVFDYVCDVEIHYKDALEFHQVKTHGPSHGSFSITALTKRQTKKTTGSILGKLYALNKDDDSNVKLVLVSNVPLKISGKNCNYGELCLETLSDADRISIESTLKAELGISQVDLTRVFYIHTSMNLCQPENEIKGKLIGCFSEIKHCEPRNPNALYRLIVETVETKACYEFSEQEYETILKEKGVSRAEFSQMLDAHMANENSGIKQAQDYIATIKDISKKRRYRNALASLVEQMMKSIPLRTLERQVRDFLQTIEEIGELPSALSLLNEKFGSRFPIEYTKEEKDLFFVITLGRFETEGLDHANAF